MIQEYRTIKAGQEAEIIEKKSRFLANCMHVEAQEEANLFLEGIKKKYWNATHHCFAYILGKNQEIMRCSDDGEPSGTAGKPMLDVLIGEKLCDSIVVVTRYFGGTLLGTGGLVRAYSKSVQEGLRSSELVSKVYGAILEVESNYADHGKLQYLFGEEQISIIKSEYTEVVKMQVRIPWEQVTKIEQTVIQVTNGKAVMKQIQEMYYEI